MLTKIKIKLKFFLFYLVMPIYFGFNYYFAPQIGKFSILVSISIILAASLSLVLKLRDTQISTIKARNIWSILWILGLVMLAFGDIIWGGLSLTNAFIYTGIGVLAELSCFICVIILWINTEITTVSLASRSSPSPS